ncbi:DEAD/DEAH box helicase [Clostridium botulinum]|nr:DEAD/DEAH box helicase [Clostridium botulinum]NFJ88519.1 DEAD/DEAH box helicase [Clostridium botulinum]HDI3121665.1 DEAD/DEAH box helicase family protein [Clostridium botulinum]
MVAGKKLNLEWVTDVIKDTYKTWKCGDIVSIEAQTGTGKTYFILNVLFMNEILYRDDELLYVCNRINLKRQIKIDAARIQGIKINEDDWEALDKMKVIGKITVTSYHEIQQQILNEKYFGESKLQEYYNNYRYVVLDEVHYFKQDSFNGQTIFFFNDFIKKYNPNATTVYITATMDYIREPLLDYCYDLGKEPKQYSTGIDYSYIKPFYFQKFKNIIRLIKDDKTDDKWLIFVSNIEDAKKVLKEIDDSKFICAKGSKDYNIVDQDTLKSVIKESRFDCKVLVCTKALDNGVNIKDDLLKHIVVLTWDKVDFIQMLGRKRIDIHNAQEVNLYIHKRKKSSFTTLLERNYLIKQDEINLYSNDYVAFCRKYDTQISKLGKLDDLFYRDLDKEWKINQIGYEMLQIKIKFAEKMIAELEIDENSFLIEQLSWLRLEESFDIENNIEKMITDDNCNSVEEYLKDLYLNKVELFEDQQKKLKEFVIPNFDETVKKLQGRHKKRRAGKKILNKLFLFYEIPYSIKSDDTTRKIVDDKKVTYWVIEKKDNLTIN